HGEVYACAPPISMLVSLSSAGNAVHANDSCTQRTRRKAMFEKNCAWTPGFESTPACVVTPLLQSAAVNVPSAALNVGQVPLDAVNISDIERFSTVSCAANTGAVSDMADSPI